MRISVDQRDSGYRTYLAHLPRARAGKVRLNGQILESCITADEELGEVLVFVRDHRGTPIIQNDTILTEWRRGRVEVILPSAEVI